MTILDTDLMNEVPTVVERTAAIPREEQGIAAVTSGEVIRGQLNSIRQAESGRSKLPLPVAYRYFLKSIRDLAAFRVLEYHAAAEAEFDRLKALKIRIGTNDLRIAAIAIAHTATLVTRNARDFGQVPGLLLEVWT